MGRHAGHLAGAVALAVLLAPAALAAEEINALVWCDHTDPALIQPFEEKFGVKVNLKEYEGTGAALSLLEQSQPGDWDVFVVDGVDVPRVIDAGLLAPLPAEEFPLDDLFPALLLKDQLWRDGKMYAVSEKFGYNTISYNKDKVDPKDMEDLAIVFSDKYKGRVAIYDYYIPVIGIVALSQGLLPSEVNAANLGQIRDALFRIKEISALVGDVVSSQTALATGEVDILIGGGEWVTGVLATENPALDWVLPQQGGLRWSQSIGVFADSKRKELATEFVKYILSPEGQGRLATSSCYWAMPANRKATLDEAQKAILRWDQQDAYIANSHLYYIPDAALDQQMLDVWTEMLQH